MQFLSTPIQMLRHEMKIAIIQPYFYPYIGYFQLIAEVDLFVIYDDIQYVKNKVG